MTNYNTLLAGAKGLLGDCVKILSKIGVEYAVVGGWSPLILNSGEIKHPGTHDVDLLFSDGKKESELKEIFNLFLSNGYKSSAKHNFQLLKVISVGGGDFVYNVDFLHSSDNQGKGDMFVDHLKLPVPLNEYLDETYMQMSIKAPNSEILFKESLFEMIDEEFLLPNGNIEKVRFPLINEAGLIITKTDSVKQVKRKRDSFDIYLAIKQARNYSHLVDIFKNLKQKDTELFNSLYGIREALNRHGMIWNILEYAYPTHEKRSINKDKVEWEINKFLSDVGLEPLAKHNYDN